MDFTIEDVTVLRPTTMIESIALDQHPRQLWLDFLQMELNDYNCVCVGYGLAFTYRKGRRGDPYLLWRADRIDSSHSLDYQSGVVQGLIDRTNLRYRREMAAQVRS